MFVKFYGQCNAWINRLDDCDRVTLTFSLDRFFANKSVQNCHMKSRQKSKCRA